MTRNLYSFFFVLLLALAGVMLASGQSPSPSSSASPSPSASSEASPSATASPSPSPAPGNETEASPSPTASPSPSTPTVPSPSGSPSASPAPSTKAVPNVRATFGNDPGVTLSGSTGSLSAAVAASFTGTGAQSGADLTVDQSSRTSSTSGSVSTATYNTTFTDSSAVLTQSYSFSTSSRSVEFAGTTYTVPARATKFSIQFDQWPLPTSDAPLVVSNQVAVGATIRSVLSTVDGDQTTLTVVTDSDLVVQIGLFTVALVGGSGSSVTVGLDWDVSAASDEVLDLTFTFPVFTGPLQYDPTVYLTTSGSTSGASHVTGFLHSALSLLF